MLMEKRNPESSEANPVPYSLGQKDVNLVGENETLAEGSSVTSVGFDGMCVEEDQNVGQRPISDQVVGSLVSDDSPVEGSSMNSVGPEGPDAECMDIDGKKASEPNFLRRVLQGEVGGDRCAKKLLVAAVHAVFLESGFVGYDSLVYSLPELFGCEGGPEFVKRGLCQSLWQTREGRIQDVPRELGPVIDLVWGNCDTVGADRARIEREVFEFWKIVKDGLAYPLLIDLCEKCGLGLPPCLMRLTMDLKFKIFESLSGLDVARLGCVCTEMRYLSSDNDLWKRKMIEEFGSVDVESGTVDWKQKFASRWGLRKRRRLFESAMVNGNQARSIRRVRPLPRVPNRHPFPAPRVPVIWGDPDPVGVPPINPVGVGGDYDALPELGVPAPDALPLPGLGVRAPARQRPPHGFLGFSFDQNI